MANRRRDEAIDLTALPFLTTRRACILVGCHATTLRRSPITPVKRGGRTLMWPTADVLAWMRGELGREQPAAAIEPMPVRTSAASSESALERIRATARGDL